MWEMIGQPEKLDIPNRTRNSVQDFAYMIRSFQAQLKEKNAFEVAAEIGKKSGLIDELYKDKTPEGVSRYENLQELLNGIREYTEQPRPELAEDEVAPENDLAAYLQQISLLTDADREDDDPDKVKLMTVHAAKGLEFPCVFVVGLEENLFPSMLSLNSREDLEEERRLFYVAITRAKDRLTITYATTRFKYGTPTYGDESRFIEELGKENLELIGLPKPEQTRSASSLNPWGMARRSHGTSPGKTASRPLHHPALPHLRAISKSERNLRSYHSQDSRRPAVPGAWNAGGTRKI